MSLVKVDIRKAVYTMQREFRDLTTKQLSLGVARALNHVAAKSRTRSIREIRTRYKIRAKELRGTTKRTAGIRVRRASKKDLQAMIIATGYPLDLRGFSPRQTKRGVSVNIMGQRRLIKGAFMARMPSGYRGVFGRGEYRGGTFVPRTKPGPRAGYKTPGIDGVKTRGYSDLGITRMVGVSVPAVFGNKELIANLERGIEKDFPDRLRHELTYIKFGR